MDFRIIITVSETIQENEEEGQNIIVILAYKIRINTSIYTYVSNGKYKNVHEF